MNKTVAIIAVLIFLLFGGYFLLGGKRQGPATQAPQPETETTTETESLPGLDEEEVTEATNEVEIRNNSFTVESGNFFFKPVSLTAESGKVSVEISKNTGFHTFIIDELGVKEQLSARTTFSFNAEKGTYEYYCDVPGHKEKGMFGTLKVN